MSGSVNKVILVGNLCADPDARTMSSGGKVVNMTIATNEAWRDKATGEKRERAEFHRVVIFSEGLAKVAEQYLKKGAKVYIEGQLQTRKWQDQSGADKYSTEIVLQGFSATLTMLDTKGDSQPQQSNQSTHIPAAKEDRHIPPAFEGGGDGIPF